MEVDAIASMAERWVEDLQQSGGYSARTLEGYLHCLSLLVRYGVTRVNGITRDNVARWLYERRRKERVKAATSNRNLAAVCAFCSWLERNGRFELAELERIRRCRVREEASPPPQALTHEQFAKLLAVAPSVSPVFELAADLDVHTGLRVHELLQVDHADFVFEDPEPFLRVARTWGRQNKRRRERTVPLGACDGAFVKKLRALGVGPPHVGPVFPAQHAKAGGPYIHKNTLEDWMKVARAAAGLPSWTTFLVLRHTFAHWVLRGRVVRNIAELALWMGNSVNTCMKHYSGWIGGDSSIEKAFAPAPPQVLAPLVDDRPVFLNTKKVSEKTTPDLFRIMGPLPEDLDRLRAAERAIGRAREKGLLP